MISSSYNSGFFILRTPLLPYSSAFKIFDALNKSGTDPLDLFTAMIKENKVIDEALYVGSPGLHAQLHRYMNGEVVKKNALRKLQESLYEYLIRMSTRCTPFGLFACCSHGTWNEQANTSLDGPLQRLMRLDMDYITEVTLYLLNDPAVSGQLKYYSNTSMYDAGKFFRYTEYRFTGQNMRSHHIVSIEKNLILNMLIKKSEQGLYFNDLVALVTDKGYDPDDAKEYVQELCRNQVLISEIDPNVTGQDFTTRLSRLLSIAYKIDLPILNELRKIEEMMAHINESEDKVDVYKKISNILSKYPVRLAEGRLFQVDSYRDVPGLSLSFDQKQSVMDGLGAMLRLNPLTDKTKKIITFRNAFNEAYEGQMIPLAQALDTEMGIGYNKAMSLSDTFKDSASLEYNSFVDFKFNKYKEWLAKDLEKITISEQDVQQFGRNTNPLANSISTTVSLLKENGEEKIFIRSCGGPSGANMIGRFAHSNEKVLKDVLNLCEEEEKLEPDKIFAEVVHLPQARMGNVLARPILRQFEIPYLASSTLPADNLILLRDLYLYMNNDRLVLFSKKLKKEVVPRLSSAHNFRNGLPVYNFLCDLQSQDVQIGCFWDWGFLNNQAHLPRVEYKNTILAPATWVLYIKDIENISKLTLNEEIIASMNEVRNRLKIPKFVYLAENDNQLMLDLDTGFCISYLARYIIKKQSARIFECILENNGAIEQEGNFYANEFIVPLLKKEQLSPNTVIKKDLPAAKNLLQRKFIPGSEWIYFKLYLSYELTDALLAGHIVPLLKSLVKSGKISLWFFLRFGDPKHHLRIRIKLIDQSFFSPVLDEIHSVLKKYADSNMIKEVALGTYVREIERYGESTMEISEAHFNLSSLMVGDILKIMAGKEYKDLMNLSILLYFDHFMNNAGFSITEKIELVSLPAKTFERNYLAGNKNYKVQLSDYSRTINKTLDKLIAAADFPTAEEPELAAINKVLKKYAASERGILEKVILKTAKNPTQQKRIFYSYLHMFVNRLLSKFVPETENKLFYVLWKFYLSLEARTRQS